MNKLAVLFPGAGYGADAPLLYYADFLFETMGYKRFHVNYQQPWQTKLSQLLSAHQEIVFISKSIGTVEAGKFAAGSCAFIKQIFLTPIEETLPYINSDCSVVIGTCDSFYSKISCYCKACNAKTLFIEGGNHSLEIPGHPWQSIQVLQQVIQFMQTV